MPKLNDENMENFGNIGTYGFSGTRLDDLGSTSYTLVNLCVDISGSVMRFSAELEKCVKEVVKACQLSPQADNLMIRLVKFNDYTDEVHGFKLLDKINLDDYNGAFHCGGGTALYDTVINAMDATTAYAKSLMSSDFQCNALTVVLTDGDDNMSSFGKQGVHDSLEKAVTSEALESLSSILVGVNVQNAELAKYLNDFQKEAGFTQYVELDNADSKTLAKLDKFISRSISMSSTALGSGGPSKSLSF